MINNKKGLSAIIVTLIMILLVIVAAGLIWVVIRNVVTESTEQIGTGTACLNVDVAPNKVTNTSEWSYAVTMTRNAGGDPIGGVNIIITNASETSSFVFDLVGNIAPLETVTKNVNTTGNNNISNANKVEVVVYFTDSSGNNNACTVSNSFDFKSTSGF